MSSSNLRRALNLLQKMSVETGTPMEEIAKNLSLELNRQAERRSSAEKEIIEIKVQELFNSNDDLLERR